MFEQRGLEIEARHDKKQVDAAVQLRFKGRMSAKDAYDLQELIKEGEKHILMPICAECHLSLTVISHDGMHLEIVPHECPDLAGMSH